MKKSTLLQLAPALDPKLGGPISVIQSTDFLDEIFEVDRIFIGSFFEFHKEFISIRAILNNTLGVPGLGSYKNLINHIAKCDIVLSHGFYMWTSLLAIIFGNGKIFVMPHGSLEEYQWGRSRVKKKLFDKLFFYFAAKKYFLFLVATRSEEESVLKKFPNAKTRVVGLGINPPELFRVRRVAKNKTIKLITLSRITHKKRIDRAIESLDFLPKNSNKYHLRVSGTGDINLLSKLKSTAARLTSTNEVEFTGWISQNQIETFIDDADIFLLPSENENFAVAVAQSIARGLPVIVSEEVALAHFVRQYECGVVLKDISPNSISQAIVEVTQNIEFFSQNCIMHGPLLYWGSVKNNWFRALEGDSL